MKRIISIFLVTAFIVCCLPFAASAANYDNEFLYKVNNKEVTVTDYIGTAGGVVTVPNSIGGYPVVEIGDYAFFACKKVTGINLPGSLKKIGTWSFNTCTGLTTLTIPDSVASIGKGAFYNCTSLFDIVIGKVLSEIAFSDVFSNCKIKKLTVTKGVYTLNRSMISSLSSTLETVDIPSSIVSMEDSAFKNFKKLKTVEFSSGLKTIGASVFEGCSSLKTVTIPSSVSSIQDKAFLDCSSLKSIYIPATVTSFGEYSIGYYTDSKGDYRVNSGLLIYCPSSSAAQRFARSNDIYYSIVDSYVKPSYEQCVSKVRSVCPYATDKQITACIESVSSTNACYTTNDILEYAKQLDYTFPTVSGDFNGDGIDDIAQFYNLDPNQTDLDVMYSTGSSFKRVHVWNSGSGFALNSFKKSIVSGDFNGDGRDDICAFYDYGGGHARTFVWISTLTEFRLYWHYWEMKSGFSVNNILNRITVGDYNGDGLDDICAFYDYSGGRTRAFVWQSNGSKFTLKWDYWYMTSGFAASSINYTVTSGDYNGDGVDDVCAFYDYTNGRTRSFVWLNNKTKFTMNWNYWYIDSGFPVSKIRNRIVSGDFDNDGIDDVCGMFDYGNSESRCFVWQSSGTTFSLKWGWWYTESGFDPANVDNRFVSGDFNGDGYLDVATYYCYNNGTGRAFVFRSTTSSFVLDWNWWLG